MKITLINGSPRRGNASSKVILDSLATCIAPGCQAPSAKTGQTSAPVPTFPVVQDILFARLDAGPGRLPEAGELDADVLVLAFPLYVDSLPSHLLAWLHEIQPLLETARLDRLARGDRAQGFACIANCGFHEGRQNKSALDILWHFSRAAGLDWIAGLGIGTGEMIRQLKDAPPLMFIKRPVTRCLEGLAAKILSPEQGRDYGPHRPGLEPSLAANSPSSPPSSAGISNPAIAGRSALPAHLFTAHAFPRFLYILAGHAGWKAMAKSNGLKPRHLGLRPLKQP